MMSYSLPTASPKDMETMPHDKEQVAMLSPLQLLRGFHPRKRFETLAEAFRNTFQVGNYWYWLEAPELAEGIEIAKLVCPLRYDVVVRRDFYSFYRMHRDLYRSDFDAFAKLVSQSTYYTWFMESEAVYCWPRLVDDQERLWALFVKRIGQSVALYESMEKHGSDGQFPIALRTGEKLLPPAAIWMGSPTGKLVSDRYFLADGCHRVAWLMSRGYTMLPADYIRVQCFREFSPFDSTSLLAHSLPIRPSEYFAFLSSRYCHPFIFEDRQSFLGHLANHRPELLEEVLSLIRVDGFEASDS